MTIVNNQPTAPPSNTCAPPPPYSQQSSPGSGCPPPSTTGSGPSFSGSGSQGSTSGAPNGTNGPSPSGSVGAVPPISTTPGGVIPSGAPPTSSTGSGSHGPSPSNLSNCTCNVLPAIPPGAASNPPGGSAAALLSAAASQRASCPVHSHSPIGAMVGPPNVGGTLGPSGPVGTSSCGVPGTSCGPIGPVNMSGPVGSPCGGPCGPGPCHPAPGGSPCGMPGPPGHMPPGMNAMGPGDPMFGPGPNKMPPGDPFYSSPFSPYYRRHTPYMASPEYRMYDMNKRLQQRTEESDNLWWDAFATEFFEDDATLSLSFCLEDGPKRYTIGRMLIPRYFRSIFEGGVTDLYFTLKHPKESFHQTSITLECDQTTMNTHHGKPKFIKVCTDGRLILEFTFDDLMRIRTWHFTVRCHSEFIQRSVIAMQQEPAMLEQLSKNITRQGITNYTLNYLRLCAILEPMQELMSRHKAYALNPRDCLKTTLFQKWQRMVAPPEQNRPANKRRKRKASTQAGAGGDIPAGTGRGRGKKGVPSPGPGIGGSFNLTAGDVMVVGEPTLMGGEFGDEDERLITRLENSQFDASAAAAGVGGPDGAGGPDPGGSGGPGINGPLGPLGSDGPGGGPHLGGGGSLGGGRGGVMGGPGQHSFQGSPWGGHGGSNGPLNSIDKKPLIPGVNGPADSHNTPVSS